MVIHVSPVAPDAGATAPERVKCGTQGTSSILPLEEEEAGADDDDMGEHAPVRARKLPPTPSQQEVEEHDADRYPYRAWCRYCVASARRRGASRRRGRTSPDA